MIAKANRVERVYGLNRARDIFPKHPSRGRAVIEAHAELVQIRGEECDSSLIYLIMLQRSHIWIPIYADRWFPRLIRAPGTGWSLVDLITRWNASPLNSANRYWLKRNRSHEALSQWKKWVRLNRIRSRNSGNRHNVRVR